jgi:DNA-binding NarL/FixJ family response regulator
MIRILLIEDNEDDALYAKECLEATLHEGVLVRWVTTLRKGITALENCEPECPDLVLLDLGLPDRKGVATLDALMAAESTVPVLVMSGYDDKGVGEEVVRRGAKGFLRKGATNARQLADAVREVCPKEASPGAHASPDKQQESDGRSSLGVDLARQMLPGLSAISDYARRIRDRSIESDDRMAKLAQAVLREVGRMRTLLVDPDSSRAQQSGLSTTRTASVRQVLHQTLQSILPILQRNRIRVETSLPSAKLPVVDRSPEQVQQALTDLFMRARDAVIEKHVGRPEGAVMGLSCKPVHGHGRSWLRITIEYRGLDVAQAGHEEHGDPADAVAGRSLDDEPEATAGRPVEGHSEKRSSGEAGMGGTGEALGFRLDLPVKVIGGRTRLEPSPDGC